MPTRRALALLLVAACDPPDPPPIDSSGPVTTVPLGGLGGTLSIDDDGRARYSVPIVVPPGRAGVQPELAIAYDSAGGDGPLGWGFRLTGLSSITRCASSIATDTYRRGVALDAHDKYCLDGERLIIVGFVPGAVDLRTEQDRFTRVLGYTDGSGYVRFEVYGRNGSISSYGASEASRVRGIAGSSEAVQTWLLDEVRDRSGNFMTVEYERIDLPGIEIEARVMEAVPSAIRYTGFDGPGAAALPTTRVVELVHRERPDPIDGFKNGHRRWENQLLAGILTWADGELVRVYRLDYTNDSATGRSRVSALTECVPAAVAPGYEAEDDLACKPPVRFEWQKHDPSRTGPGAYFESL
jgi:hypothetical protein